MEHEIAEAAKEAIRYGMLHSGPRLRACPESSGVWDVGMIHRLGDGWGL
jgi:hypothetical protein